MTLEEKKIRIIKPMTMCSQCLRPYKEHQESQLGHQFTPKFVGGVVNIDPRVGGNHPHTFFELDTRDKTIHEKVIKIYEKYNLDLVYHIIGKGAHFFGGMLDRQIWIEWYSELKPLNVAFPPLTLRVTRKFDDEIFEKPIYYEAQEVLPNWSRALMHFLNKEKDWKNSTDIRKAIYACGIPKYFKETVYPIILKE